MRRTEHTVRVMELLATHGEAHGWTVIQETGIAGGTVYPMLSRLVDRGLATDRWDDENPQQSNLPRRHLYSLTEAGMELYREWGSR